MPQRSKAKKQEWLFIELDEFAIIIPSSDEKIHGFLKKKGQKQLTITDKNCTKCPCGPSIELGVVEDGEFNEYRKPLIVHNSFLDTKRLSRQMKSLFG